MGPSPTCSWLPGRGTHPERSSGCPWAPWQKCSACTAERAPRRTNWGSGAGAAMCSPADGRGRERPWAPQDGTGAPGSPRRQAPLAWSPRPALCAPQGPFLPSPPRAVRGVKVQSSRGCGLSPPPSLLKQRASQWPCPAWTLHAPTVCRQDAGLVSCHRPGGPLSQSTCLVSKACGSPKGGAAGAPPSPCNHPAPVLLVAMATATRLAAGPEPG